MFFDHKLNCYIYDKYNPKGQKKTIYVGENGNSMLHTKIVTLFIILNGHVIGVFIQQLKFISAGFTWR